MRHPKLAEYLDVNHPFGLTDVLTGQHDLDDALIPWRSSTLSILLAGTLPADPSAVLGSRAMATTIQELRERFDTVIIDTPPLLAVTDTAVVAHSADGALLIARHGKTTREQLRRAVDALRAADSPLLGTILTFAPTRRRRGNGYGPQAGTSHQPTVERDRWT